MRRTRQPVTIVTAALATLTMLAVPATAQDYPPRSGEVIDATIVVENPEATIEVSGRGWSGDTTIEITYHDGNGTAQTLGQVTTNAAGDFTTAVTLPEGVDASDVTFNVVDTAGGDSDSFTLAGANAGNDSVAAGGNTGTAASGADSAALAATGAPTGAMALSLALLTAGALAVGGARWWSRRIDTRG